MKNLYDLESYRYELPEELIAKRPLEKRDASRLLLIDRKLGTVDEKSFADLPSLLTSDDTLILNNTKVIKARLYGRKESGAKIEAFYLKENEIMAKPGKKLREGDRILFGPDFSCLILETLESGNKRVRFECDDLEEMLNRYGELPIPHYMGREAETIDETRYQTVFAKERGSVAAPTAGLHFTPELLAQIPAKIRTLTLHVGLGTFKPVQTADIRDHQMHSESYFVPEGILDAYGRKIAVGTTALRTLESSKGKPGSGETNLFVYPGYQFQVVDALITNFHLPCSSLLMLVSAFAGYELTMEAYRIAVQKKFRFLSYGDAMFIV